jgi:hypothetical protein
MLSLINWLTEKAIKKKRKKNGEQYDNQGSGKIGNVDHQGKVDRNDQKIISNDVLYIAEPKQ